LAGVLRVEQIFDHVEHEQRTHPVIGEALLLTLLKSLNFQICNGKNPRLSIAVASAGPLRASGSGFPALLAHG